MHDAACIESAGEFNCLLARWAANDDFATHRDCRRQIEAAGSIVATTDVDDLCRSPRQWDHRQRSGRAQYERDDAVAPWHIGPRQPSGRMVQGLTLLRRDG